MVVGAGPAGMECARALGQRGYRVSLLDACREPGGRVLLEANLPGLQEWRRVLDWRLVQLQKLKNVRAYPSSRMSAEAVLEAEARHVIVATGATWRRDGIGRTLWKPIPGLGSARVFTPDDVLNGRLPAGRVVIYDDDHYYMGGVLAELLAAQDCTVTLVTPAPLVSYWSTYTLEQERVQRKLMQLGVTLYVQRVLAGLGPGSARVSSSITGQAAELECDAAVLVTDRVPNDGLYYELQTALEAGRLKSLRLIGDAEAPNIIAQAVFSGHLAAREFDEPPVSGTPFKIERPAL
jgi:dimethylamine/trimethylamine dehydrogenase